jgi:hypothetical protein
MADLLVTDPVEVAAEARSPSPWDPHPPASLRMRLMTIALMRVGFRTHAKAYWAGWCASFDVNAADPVFGRGRQAVTALASGAFPQLGGKTLSELLRFSDVQMALAEKVMKAALGGLEPVSGDIRCLVAGARFAFDTSPDAYVRETGAGIGAGQRILDRALNSIGDAPRSAPAERAVTPEDDRAAGKALFARLEELSKPYEIERGVTG